MILDAVPNELVAGDTWRWTRSFSDYPAPTWTVTYYFENQEKQFSALAVASGTSQAVTIAAGTTAAYPPGKYKWSARATDGSVTETIPNEEGWLTVSADPAATGSRDQRSWAQRTLEAVEATLEGRATDGQLKMAIGQRAIERIPLSELLTLKKELEQQVRIDEAGGAAGLGRKLQVRIGRG